MLFPVASSQPGWRLLMKRLLALLVVLGIVVAAGPARVVVARDEKKDEKKDKDKDKKDDKKDKDKKDEKKDEKKDKDKKDEKPAAKPLTEEQKKALETLSGNFTVTLFERDGKKEPADA